MLSNNGPFDSNSIKVLESMKKRGIDVDYRNSPLTREEMTDRQILIEFTKFVNKIVLHVKKKLFEIPIKYYKIEKMFILQAKDFILNYYLFS